MVVKLYKNPYSKENARAIFYGIFNSKVGLFTKSKYNIEIEFEEIYNKSAVKSIDKKVATFIKSATFCIAIITTYIAILNKGFSCIVNSRDWFVIVILLLCILLIVALYMYYSISMKAYQKSLYMELLCKFVRRVIEDEMIPIRDKEIIRSNWSNLNMG